MLATHANAESRYTKLREIALQTAQRTLLFFFIVIISSSAYAQSAAAECEYTKDLVPHKEIKGDDIEAFVWNDRISTRSSESITTLNIIFKNGDLATIEHKFCSMYNFKVSYFVADRKAFVTQESAANLVVKYYKNYSIEKIEFTPSMEEVLTGKLENYRTSGNKKVEMSLETLTLDSEFPYRRLINLYIGVGGQD